MFNFVGPWAKNPYVYSCPYQTPAFPNVEITCGITYFYIFLLYTAFRVTSQWGVVLVVGWQSAKQDPTIDENSTKQEKWNSQWHETSQSMWLNYSLQNLFSTGSIILYGTPYGTCVATTPCLYMYSGKPGWFYYSTHTILLYCTSTI